MAEPKIIYKLRVIYKSGYTMDFEAYSFSFNGSSYKWHAAGDISPIDMGATEIAAVWQLGHRYEQP